MIKYLKIDSLKNGKNMKVFARLLFFSILFISSKQAQADAIGVSIGAPTAVVYSLDLEQRAYLDVGLGLGLGFNPHISYRQVNRDEIDWYWSAGAAFNSFFGGWARGAFGITADLKRNPINLFAEGVLYVGVYTSLGAAIGVKYILN